MNEVLREVRRPAGCRTMKSRTSELPQNPQRLILCALPPLRRHGHELRCHIEETPMRVPHRDALAQSEPPIFGEDPRDDVEGRRDWWADQP